MNVTRNVMHDLLTVYLAGEASDDTKAFVEEYLMGDPEMAREVMAARDGLAPLPPTQALPQTAAKEALDATRQLLKNRTSTFAIGLLFTLLPLTFVIENSRVTFFVIRDAPIVGVVWWATAAVLWIWHAAIRRRLRVSGL